MIRQHGYFFVAHALEGQDCDPVDRREAEDLDWPLDCSSTGQDATERADCTPPPTSVVPMRSGTATSGPRNAEIPFEKKPSVIPIPVPVVMPSMAAPAAQFRGTDGTSPPNVGWNISLYASAPLLPFPAR